MRRLTGRTRDGTSNRLGIRDERGAALVFVAVTMVVLIGAVSLSIDVGRIYSERRELQNGADAAALAVAQDCAFGDCGTSSERFNTAEEYADANADDGVAWVPQIDLDLDAQQVTVHTATEDPGGDHFFDMMFAKVVGYDGLTVNAEATVAWGAPRGLSTLPIIFSICEWEKFTADLHPKSAYDDGLLPDGDPIPTDYSRRDDFVEIFFHQDSGTCHKSPSGQDLPGGFGWLSTDGSCEADIDEGGWVAVNPGAGPDKKDCPAKYLSDLVGTIQLIPYFDDIVGTGSGATYHVAGFGAVYITGYDFLVGGYREDSWIDGEQVCKSPESCIQGYLIDGILVNGYPPGPGPDFGVVSIGFVK